MKSKTGSQKNIDTLILEAYDLHADEIFRFALTKVRNRDLALDLAQDTFAKTWNYLNKGNEIQHIRGFLYKTLRNAIIDSARKQKPTKSLDELISEGKDFGATAQQLSAENLRDGKIAMELLDRIDAGSKEIISLHYINDLTIAEIASILGARSNTISVRLHRAQKKLSQVIENEIQMREENRQRFQRNLEA